MLVNLDGVHRTTAGALSRITPIQALPHQGGGILPSGSQRAPLSNLLAMGGEGLAQRFAPEAVAEIAETFARGA